jgi:hypothetical protein
VLSSDSLCEVDSLLQDIRYAVAHCAAALL